MIHTVNAENQTKFVEFYSPFIVHDSRTIETHAFDIMAPEVYHDDVDDIEIINDNWEAMTGYTGQYSYNGAVMHPSEQLAGRLAQDILDEPGIYLLAVVDVMPTEDSESEEPAGWCVLRYIEQDAPCCIANVTSGGTDHIPGCEG